MNEYKHWLPEETLRELCFHKAQQYLQDKLMCSLDDIDDIAKVLFQTEIEKYSRDLEIEKLLDYTDEIVSIEELNDRELIDITVSQDSLFYANNILTKNSHGLAMTCDLLIAIIRTEELDEMNQMMFQQLKNRYNDVTASRRFVVGVDRPRMRLYDVSQPEKNLVGNKKEEDDVPGFDKGRFGQGMKAERKDFSQIKV
jgi:hypothetical protein